MADKPPLKVPQPDADTTRAEDHSLNAPGKTRVIFYGPRRQPTGDRYDLERLFLEWAWFTRIPGGWEAAVRVLARTLHGLEGAGLIERRTIRRAGRAPHHGFVLTDLGRKALDALSGEWIKDRR